MYYLGVLGTKIAPHHIPWLIIRRNSITTICDNVLVGNFERRDSPTIIQPPPTPQNILRLKFKQNILVPLPPPSVTAATQCPDDTAAAILIFAAVVSVVYVIAIVVAVVLAVIVGLQEDNSAHRPSKC